MEKKKTYQSMKTLSDTLHQSKTVRQLFNNHSFLLFRLRQKWKDIVGEMPAKYSYIGFGKGNTLFVYVTNSALTQHLFMMKSELLKSLGEDEYGKQFTDIRFLAGTPKKETAGKTTVDKINDRLAFREKMYDQPLTEKEKKRYFSLDTSPHQRRKTERNLRKTDCPVLPERQSGNGPRLSSLHDLRKSDSPITNGMYPLRKQAGKNRRRLLYSHFKRKSPLQIRRLPRRFGKTGQKNKNHPRPSSFFL